MSAFTPDSELELLFTPGLIPAEVKALLGSDLHMRPLAKTDLSRSHLKVLSVLTSTPDLTEAQYAQAFDRLRSCPDTYFTLVIVARETDQIVGVGSVFLEQKFTRNLGTVGHIEDIAVDKSMQGRKLGLRIINALTGISERMGCYKTILNCSDANVPFYQKCGFEKKENEMARYHSVGSLAATSTTASTIPAVSVPLAVPERLVHTPRL
ncbi:glucosamine 6-phosphate N-acetyltransferase [Gymnopilus junonius]|uniref:Glucosamine 6-phosphate N-acetyltransferase n=1 Tax=Gymnopilus junonius TaxID=109634 RepID=A0A9P5NLY3_GYMJU|nr:glucosamine 6-phosphate N-acetyltransferase [Gymnopilus junonius]